MHIILTHEQADFDAVASLLGAHLVDESGIPVLPRKMNRNVRAYLTLYGMDLPFVDPRDLPGKPIDQVTIVDTQSMISVKGLLADAKVRIIDHHPLREDLPPGWDVTTEDIGATSTLFVEALREQNGHLDAVQSTLLLLGIYEDTGSLTYNRTTPRDLIAAAFLLEQGASLEIAADFLNHPLSSQQQQLYDRLRDNIRTLEIKGHTIVLVCGEAGDMDEELSSVAHKLRDLLDPDALFLLVTTRGGVQLIARSNSEDIDVARIADHFGGGGHSRAAAGLIRERSLESVCEELIMILPDHVKPAITVAQIMSRDPQLLTPETSVEEAARRMQRYGYEGFPVVTETASGRHTILGLLTRRAVDKALAHKLNLNALSLMDAGDFSVSPDDSIEDLQQLMTETGWGQIPVVDRARGKVIGIVTRTDLLKTLTNAQGLPGRLNLASRLESALPPARLILLKAVARHAHEQHAALYIVGGFVRDLILELPSQDFDLVVEGDAIQLARALAANYGGRVTSHTRFGTAKWHIKEIRQALLTRLVESEIQPDIDAHQMPKEAGDLPDTLDLISARTEFYTHPTALPTVERGSIKLDLHRRDFTINTLAVRLDGYHYGELHDYWGGLSDLRQGTVRVLHSLSFVDDPTRMLRAVRFEQRFGFRIEERTLELIHEARSLLTRVSGDRIRHELDHILAEEKVDRMLSRLAELDLLSPIHPDLIWDDWLAERFERLKRAEPAAEWGIQETQRGIGWRPRLAYIIWLVRLPAHRERQIISRLKIPRALADEILAARTAWKHLPHLVDLPPSQIDNRLSDLPPLSQFALYLISDPGKEREVLWEYASRWKQITPTIDGHVLMKKGLPPGPAYRQVLSTLRAAWLDGKVKSTQEESRLLEDLLETYTAGNVQGQSPAP